MYKQVYIMLLGIVLLALITPGRSLMNNDTDIGYPPNNETMYSRNATDGMFDSMSKRGRGRGIGGNQQFAQDMLSSHNRYRQKHCAPPLRLNENLMQSAQQYADKLAAMNKMVHSGAKGLGENLYMMSGDGIGNTKGSQATDSWYNEIKFYNFRSGAFSMQTGHFTQVVWKASTEIGVGIAFTSNKRAVYVVAQYTPPGNYQGQFQQNVLPAKC